MVRPFSIILGKAVRRVARLRGGNGSALPGLFVEHIDPNFTKRILDTLPHGVVLVSGTNGKTTTTKIIVELLEGQGLRVFTNRTGSNFSRGVAAALLSEISLNGKLKADIAVLELDEAHAVHFVRSIAPRHTLLLNVMRDQLDRFGEIDTTAKLLATIAKHTTGSLTLNREDPRIATIADLVPKTVSQRYFGLSPQLTTQFPNDDNLHEKSSPANTQPRADVTLDSFESSSATFIVDDKKYTTKLKLTGVYNLFNAAAALATVRNVLGDTANVSQLVATLSNVKPAFGRGETITVNGQPLELVLVKNPSGFRLGLTSFPPKGYVTMITVNDNYADGRDMSWLWDVPFDSLQPAGVDMVSGIRAYDMALRLDYDNVPVKSVVLDIKQSLQDFMTTHPNKPKRIFCTYTAMLALRKEIGLITTVEAIDK